MAASKDAYANNHLGIKQHRPCMESISIEEEDRQQQIPPKIKMLLHLRVVPLLIVVVVICLLLSPSSSSAAAAVLGTRESEQNHGETSTTTKTTSAAAAAATALLEENQEFSYSPPLSREQQEERLLMGNGHGGDGNGISKDFPCYRTMDEIYETLNDLSIQYPDLVVSVSTIGQSYWKQQDPTKGNDIKVIVIGGVKKNQSTTDGTTTRPPEHMMIVGGQHSRELPPPETLLRWMEYLLGNYGIDPDITWILDRTRIHIVPNNNPDGRQIVQDDLESEHRKNGRPNSCRSKDGQQGVDLNRNYPMFFGDDSGSSSDPCDGDYRGTGPLSEPETQAVFEYATSVFEHSNVAKGNAQEAWDKWNEPCPTNSSGIFMDVHSSGNLVYFPWGYDDIKSPNHQSLLTMAAKLAKPGNYRLWGPGQDGFYYRTSGDATDATYGMNCIFSQGYEIGTERYATCEELEYRIIPTMKESLLYAAKCVSAPYLLPLGPDIIDIISVNSTNSSNVSMIVQVSDEAMIVEHANFDSDDDDDDDDDKSKKSQPIAQVKVFVNEHPYDDNGDDATTTTSDGTATSRNTRNVFLMEPEDGVFDSAEEIATLTLDLSYLEPGRHTLYFQATDADGYAGPASAVYIHLNHSTTTTAAAAAAAAGEESLAGEEKEEEEVGMPQVPKEPETTSESSQITLSVTIRSGMNAKDPATTTTTTDLLGDKPHKKDNPRPLVVDESIFPATISASVVPKFDYRVALLGAVILLGLL